MPCTLCKLYQKAKTNCMPMSGNINAKVLFVGEAPGGEEDNCGIQFVGKSGRLLREKLKKHGIDDFAVTNTCRCRPPNNRPPDPEEIKACLPYLLADIASMPNLQLIVAVGNIALRALTGKQQITKVSGEEWEHHLEGDRMVKLMPLMHPSYVLQNQAKELVRFDEHVSRIPNILSGSLSSEQDFGEYIVVNSRTLFNTLRDEFQTHRVFAYDIETTGLNPWDEGAYIKCIQFSFELKKAYVLPLPIWETKDQEFIHETLQLVFEDKKIGKVGQNIKFDNLWMKVILGISVKGTIWDTKCAEYLLVGTESIGLKDMAWRYSKMGGYEKRLPDSPEKIDGEDLWKYGGIDADLTFRIFKKQKTTISPEQDYLLRTLLVPVSDVLMNMEYHGIKLDMDRVVEATKACEDRVESLRIAMDNLDEVKEYERAEEVEFNPNSHKQVAYILFKICGLKPMKQTEKGADSTDKEVLRYYATSSKLAELLLDYSAYEQMRRTFLSELSAFSRSGRIHTTLWLTETTTGRTSSKKPNMQNMPKGEKDILGLRKCFIADEGYQLMEADMNQHELRVMAEIAGDQAMLDALGGDIHRATACAIYNCQPSDVTGDMRRQAKTVNFGIIYGLTPYGLSQQLGIPESQAELWIFRFFEKYHKTKKYMEDAVAFCRKFGYVEALSGRRRYFPSYEEFDITKAKEAINFPIQSTASDILLYNAIGIDRLLRGKKSFLVLEVHDSLLFNIHSTEHHLIREIRRLMCEYSKQFIPFASELKCDIKMGPNWADMEDYSEDL